MLRPLDTRWSSGIALLVGEHSAVPSPTNSHLLAVVLSSNGSAGWAVGENGTILQLAGGGWTKMNGLIPQSYG
jgi:photosystem II stability/assembly factor-like uncharacterized protein